MRFARGRSTPELGGSTAVLGSLFAIAFILLGAGLLAVSGDSETRRTLTAVDANGFVNAEGRDRFSIVAHNSPGVARSPVDASELAVAGRVDEPDFSCALHISSDGGRSWSRRAIPAVPGATRKCYAPDVAFDAGGTLIVVFATLRGAGNVPDALWISHSSDGGRTLSPPRRAAGPIPFQARLVADPQVAQRLYLTWLDASGVGLLRLERTGNPILMARSDDGGFTWSRPVRVSDARRERVVAPAPAIGRGHELYVLYLDLGNDRLDYEGGHRGRGGAPYDGTWQLVLARSRDGGRRWEETVVEPRVTPAERFVVFLPPFPSLAVDRDRGRLYAAFADARLGDADAWLWESRDGARTWNRRRVNDNPAGDGTAQYLPRLALAPDGRLDVVYYDRRADRRNVRNDVSLQSTTENGAFTASLRLSDRSFDSRIGFGSERGMADLGGRLGLISDDAGALAVWPDTRAGSARVRRQDLAHASVSVSDVRSESSSGLRRGGGIALIVLGLAVGLLTLRGVMRPVGPSDDSPLSDPDTD